MKVAKTEAEGVRFVGINTRDPSREAAIRFEEEYGASYPSLYDQMGKIMLKLPRGSVNPQTIPSTIFLDRRDRRPRAGAAQRAGSAQGAAATHRGEEAGLRRPAGRCSAAEGRTAPYPRGDGRKAGRRITTGAPRAPWRERQWPRQPTPRGPLTRIGVFLLDDHEMVRRGCAICSTRSPT